MKYIRLLAGLAGFVAMAVFLHIAYRYHFFYVEQLQLFQFAPDYLASQLGEMGGVAHLMGEFLTQYFAYPYMGPLLVAALLMTIVGCTRALLRTVAPGRELFLLYLLPAYGLLLMQLDFNYLLKGTVAFALMELSLLATLRIPRPLWKEGITLVLTLLLFGVAGPIAGLYALVAFLIDLLTRRSKQVLLFDALALAAYALVAWASVECVWVRSYAYAFTAQPYYHPNLPPSLLVYFAWGSLPLGLLCAALWRLCGAVSARRAVVEGLLQSLLFVALLVVSLPKYDARSSYLLKRLDYANRQADWQEVIRLSEGPLQNYLYVNYLNRALAERGELADRAFAFNQHGPQGLMVGWNKTFSVSLILSDVYFTLGEVALAQEMAFEANVSMIGAGSPRCLMRLVQTNLIFGAYPVAEKYIRVLEQTAAYADWARRQRVFLYDDAAVEADPLLGAKRRGLPKESDLAGIRGLAHDLLVRAEHDPSNRLPIHYVGVQQLLAKDLKGFQALLDRYYGTEVLPELPVGFQEALIMLAEKQPERWSYYNVSEATVARYKGYRDLVLKNRANPQLPQLIQRYFGSTYWAYFLLTK